MRLKYSLDGVAVFIAVTESGTFSEAARRLGVSPSAVSQAINALEQRLGTPLFRRTTRSVSLTDVGRAYCASVAPAIAQLQRATDEASGASDQASGTLRLTMPRAPFELFVAPMLVAFRERYPRIDLEIAIEARLVDIVSQGYDAGLRYGNCLEKDMVAVPVAPRSEAILVASPAYLDARTAPRTPTDLFDHHGIVCRSQRTGQIIPWTLHCGEESLRITLQSSTVVHDLASQIHLAARGLGIVNVPADLVSEHLNDGRLARVLPDWSSPLDDLYLYFPSRRHQSSALRAFIAAIKRRQPTGR